MKVGRFTRAERGLIAGAAFLVFSRVFAFSLVLPGFRDFGAGLTESSFLIGFALGSYGLTMAVAQISNGWLSDHVGRRPVLLVGSALFVLGSIWAALAGSIEALIAARLLQGLGGISSVAMAAVGETVPEERRTSAMALVGVPAGLGFFLGFVLGPILEPILGFRGLFWATALLGAAAALPLLLRGLPAPAPPIPAKKAGWPVAALAAAGFTVNFALTAVVYYMPDLSDVALAGVLVAALIAMGLASRAVDRKGAVAIPIAAGLLALAGGAAAFTLGDGWPILVGGLVFFGAHATLSAVLPSQVSRLAGRSGGRGHGVQLVVAYLGTAAGGAVAGGLDGGAAGLDAVPGDAGSVLVVALLAVAAAAACLAALRRGSRTVPDRSTGPPALP